MCVSAVCVRLHAYNASIIPLSLFHFIYPLVYPQVAFTCAMGMRSGPP